MTSVEFRTWVPSGTENQVVVTNAIGTSMAGLTVEVKPLPTDVQFGTPRPAPKPGKR